MRQIFMTVTITLGITNFVAAQDQDFRFANDPFSQAPVTRSETPAAAKPAEPSYKSFESWPGENMSLVQKNAMFRADQRRQRLAAMRWLGLSRSRPVASSTSHMTSAFFTPSWAGNYWGAHSWYGSLGQ